MTFPVFLSLFCYFLVTFSLLSGRPPKSLFCYFFVTLNFSGFRALWDLLPLTRLGSQLSGWPKNRTGTGNRNRRNRFSRNRNRNRNCYLVAFHPRPQIAAIWVATSTAASTRTEIATNARVGTKFWIMAADSNRSRPQPAAI